MASTQVIKPNPFGFRLQQTMLRIKDPKITIPFYEKNFGFKLLHKYDFEQWKFSLYFMGILPPERMASWPEPGTKEAELATWTMNYGESCLELTHNWGTEDDDSFAVNNGNVEPHRGFGHIAVMTPNVQASCDELDANGVKFQKKPNEGRMKGLAFALDPDGYWIEVISRSEKSIVPSSYKYTLAQTMKRIKDPVKSLHFYRDICKMTLLSEAHFGPGRGDFSLYFLAQLPPGDEVPSFESVLELTHNHGTELPDSDFPGYHNGNDEDLTADPPKLRGFGHIGFLVDDLNKACEYLDQENVPFKKRPEEGAMNTLAFVYDPDGYAVEIIQNGFTTL
eukprot:GSChrysophyteH1.ASY1.ANO1.653.1 assembled CDS